MRLPYQGDLPPVYQEDLGVQSRKRPHLHSSRNEAADGQELAAVVEGAALRRQVCDNRDTLRPESRVSQQVYGQAIEVRGVDPNRFRSCSDAPLPLWVDVGSQKRTIN